MKKHLTLLTFLLSLFFTNSVLADDVVVIELFTSQGCEKCPPANTLMQELTGNKNVLPLTWHVDYWDYMGWKDTLAKPEFTLRQEDYNAALGRKGVYTPQVIVNGRRQLVGSNKLDLYENIRTSIIANEMPLVVKIEGGHSNLRVRVDGPASTSGAVIKMVWYDTMQKIKISAGGNAGKTIDYVNVVRSSKNIGVWQGKEVTIPLDLNDPDRAGADCIAILVQVGETGPIIGAAYIVLNDFSS